MGGTYVLEIVVPEVLSLTVGGLGERDFTPGTYAYVGSAQGPGGFARVDRHREVASGQRETRHWHVDYLLGATETSIRAVHRFDGDRECALVGELPGTVIEDFGASDCGCPGHLLATDSQRLQQAIGGGTD